MFHTEFLQLHCFRLQCMHDQLHIQAKMLPWPECKRGDQCDCMSWLKHSSAHDVGAGRKEELTSSDSLSRERLSE